MRRQIRDECQRKAVPGLSQAPCDPLRSVFRTLSQATPQKTSDKGIESGTRRRTPGGGGNGPGPTRADTRLCVLADDTTSPPLAGLGTPLARARAPAPAPLQPLSPMREDPWALSI